MLSSAVCLSIELADQAVVMKHRQRKITRSDASRCGLAADISRMYLKSKRFMVRSLVVNKTASNGDSSA